MSYVVLPSGAYTKIREGETAQDALSRAQRDHPNEFSLNPPKKEAEPQGGFGAAFSAGLSRLGGEAALTAGKAGILGLPEAEEIYRRQQEKAERIFKPTEKGWTEDPLQKLKEVAGGSAAYMLAPAAAAGAAAFAPVTVPVIGAAGLAAGLTSLGQYTGSNIAAQMEEGKKGLAETSGALATATAIPQAALDVLSFRMMPGIKKIFGATGKEVTEAQAKALAEQTLKQKLGDYAAATGVSMGVEGATEVAQDFLEKAQAGAELTDPKARADYLESLIGGAALAGVLGPFGRGFERAGIAARGRELEQERLTAEAKAKEKERLAALEEERAFRLTPPEGLVGPETPEALQQQRLQARLAEIEQEVERARQAKDTDTLVQLFKERTALESQVAEEVPAFERMRGLQQRISGLENLAERLQREGLEAPTAADKRAIYARLVSTNKDLREAREELEKGIEKGELPTLVDYQQLLAKEKRALTNLSKAEELKDDVKELKAAQRLEESQQQLGLFGMESFRAQEEYEAEQRRRDEEAEAARLAAQKPLLLTDQRGATPIEMGINTDLFPTPPYRAGPYTQETLFGSPERVLTPSQTEMTIPQIQSTVARLGERTDLAPEDQALLERVENVAVPAPGVSIPEALQTRLTALQNVRQRIEQQLLQRAAVDISEEERAAAEAEGVPIEEERLSDTAKLKILRQKMPMSPLTKRLDRLDQIEKDLTEKLRSADRKAGTLLEKLTGRDEQNVTLRQRISDWLSDTAQGRGNEESRRALEEALLRVEQGQRGETQPLTTLKRRIATQEESKLLGGKKTVTERVPTGLTVTAQQPDLFAGTEAASAVEFETPREMQAFMASEKLQKERAQKGEHALQEAQEAGPPSPEAVRRSQKLLQPTVAYLQKQIGKLKTVVARLAGRVDNYKTMLQVRTEEQDERVAEAKQQQAQVLAALEQSLLQQHQQYALAKLELDNAKETYSGLEDLQKRAQAAMDQALSGASVWAQVKVKAKDRYIEQLREKKTAFDTAFSKLLELREQISKAQLGEATDPYTALWPEYSVAQKTAQKAFDAIQQTIRSRPNVTPPDIWQLSTKEIKQFLVQDAELTELLIGQRRIVHAYEAKVKDADTALTEARVAAKNDPVWSAFLKEAQDALSAAISISPQDRLTAPDKLRAAIQAANKQIRNIKEQQRQAAAETTQTAIRERRIAEAQDRTEKQRQTRAEIRAENERLAREAAATKQVTGLTTEQREAVQAAQARINKIIEAKEKALEEKRQQKGNFRLSDELKKAVADGKKTREQAIEEQRVAELKKLEQQFDKAIKKAQDAARALREAAPTKVSRREAAEEIEAIAETQKQKRTGPVLVDVRTGRVSEPSKAPPTRDLTEAQQAKEQAEANRIAAADANVIEERYRQGLLTYAQKVLDTDLSYLGDDTVAIEYAVLDAQARKEEDAALRQGATAKEKANIKAAREVAGVLDRVISHDYAARENTPLDATTAAAVGKGDLKSALESLAENGSTPFVRMVAKRLLPMVENTTLETASGLVDEQGRLKGGDYYAKTDTIKLNKDALTEEDLIHEAGHAATIGVIDAKPDELTKEQLAARDALEKLYAKMQGRAEFKDEYGNVSFKEFVSELLSNQQVRDKINQTAGLLRRIYEGILRMLGMLGMRGIEPKTLSDKALEQAFEMFSPSKASANKQERLASIARGGFPGTATKYSSAVPKEVQDMVNRTIARTATLGDKITANATGLRMRTFIADNWAPVEALLKMGVEKAKIKEAQALQMRVYMRLFSNQQEYTNAALLNGVPELKTDAAGVRNIEGGDAKANAQTIAAALSKASKLGNQQAVERLFTMWMASLRAKQDGVGFDKLNFKNPPTAAELAAMEQMLKDNPDVKDAFEEARRLYKEHNKRLLNLQVQTGAMSQEVADELGKGDYVGYYRVKDNGVVELMMGGSRPMRIGSVVDQPYLKELVGGEQHILPFFSSMVQNTSMLMTIALRNMQNHATANMFQDLGLGKIHSVPEGQQAPASKIHFKQKGEEYWFDADEAAFSAAGVPADLMMQGLQGVKTTIPGLVRALAVPANFLRKAVRRLPTYTLRQTIRDPMHAWMTTGGNFVPVLSTWKELYKGMTNTSQTQMTLKEAAIVGNNVYSGDTEGVADMLRQLSGDPSRFAQTMQYLDEIAMKGEAATRAVLYDTFRQKGMGHVEALLNTAETMNFSRRGTSASLHWLSTLTPFFNAQIQGLDAVYRSLKGDTTFEEKMNARNMLLKRGALLAASTMMYALMMEDDEAYKNATLAERYGNWFVPVPGTDKTIRVPIPFELGLIFKSMPEAFVNTAFGDAKAKEAIKALAKQAYMASPVGHSQSIPTAVKGPLEIAFNYNMYSDQPIETAREKALDSDQRYRDSTTEVAKLLGKFGVLSPVQIDHLVRSYTSSTGIALLSMANFALRPLTTREGVEKPERALEEMPVVGALFQPKTGRGMVNAAFDDMHRIERAANTYKTLVASDPEAARAYADEYAKEISLSSFAGSFRQQMGEFAKYKRMVAANPDLTPAEKRAQIEAVKQQEIEYAKQLRKIAA